MTDIDDITNEAVSVVLSYMSRCSSNTSFRCQAEVAIAEISRMRDFIQLLISENNLDAAHVIIRRVTILNAAMDILTTRLAEYGATV